MKRKYFNLLIVICLIPTLQSCFLAGIVAAIGGGTYYVGTKAGKREDERIKTQALIDVKRELEEKEKAESGVDQNIMNQINQNYLAGTLTGNIAVYPEVRNGVVILHGRVPDAQTAERAIQAARKTPGVERIISNLVIVNQAPQAIPLNNLPQFQGYFQAPQQQQQQQMMMQPQQPARPQTIYEYRDSLPPQRMQYQQVPEGSMNNMNNPMYQQMQPTQQNLSYNNRAYQQYSSPVNQQFANKAQNIQQKQAPPVVVTKNNKPIVKVTNNTSKSSQKSPTKTPQDSKPKLLSEEQLAQYAEDNDSKYKPPVANRTVKNSTVKKSLPVQNNQNSNNQKKDVVYVPVAVPVPVYYEDNDSSYIPLGGYIPANNTQNYNNGVVGTGIPEIPLPVADENQDNDTFFKMEYY
jgi:hypothetical protein